MSELIRSLSAAWSPYFGAMIVQNTLFLAAVLVVLRLLRGAPASVRAAVASAAAVKMILPPLLPLSRVLAPGSAGPAAGTAGSLFALTFADAAGRAGTGPVAEHGWGTAGVLLAIWAAGAALMLGWTIVSAMRFSRVLGGSRPLPAGDVPEAAARAGIEVAVSTRIAMPLTFGIMPRRIHVPAREWRLWTPRVREMVVRHELAHIRRRDGIVQVLQAVVRALWFFHPLVWVLDRRLGEYREMACDDASAGRERGEASEYSRCLVEIAASLAGHRPACMTASAFIRRRNELLRRVRYQLAEGGVRMMSTWRKAALAAGLVMLVASLSWYGGGASAQDDRQAAEASQEHGGSTVYITATLKDDGSIVIVTKDDRREISDLGRIFAGMMEYDPERTVVEIHCEDGVTMDRVYAFQNEMQKRGISRMQYVASGMNGIPLRLPPPEMLDRLSGMPEAMVAAVRVDGSGGLNVDGKEVGEDDLRGVIASRLAGNEAIVVKIETDGDTPFAAFVQTLAAVTGAGAQRVAVMPPAKPAG